MRATREREGAAARAADGNIGRQNRSSPYVPILRRTPARITEPAVGASTCASGSQVWNGKRGTLIAKARRKAEKSQNSAPGESRSTPVARLREISTRSKVVAPLAYNRYRIARNISREPDIE